MYFVGYFGGVPFTLWDKGELFGLISDTISDHTTESVFLSNVFYNCMNNKLNNRTE